MNIEENVLEKIKSAANDIFAGDLVITITGAEIVFLAQHIKRLEEKEQILNALLNKKIGGCYE